MKRRSFLGSIGSIFAFLGLSAIVKAKEEAPKIPESKILHTWAKWLRDNDGITMDLFRDIVILDNEAKHHYVPILWASDEKVVTIINLNEGIIKLPIMNLQRGDFDCVPVSEKNYGVKINYHLTVRTLYEEDMNQIVEQVFARFIPYPITRLEGYKLRSIANNNDLKNDFDGLGIHKYIFNIEVCPEIPKREKK
jgi:hypothetical protein